MPTLSLKRGLPGPCQTPFNVRNYEQGIGNADYPTGIGATTVCPRCSYRIEDFLTNREETYRDAAKTQVQQILIIFRLII